MLIAHSVIDYRVYYDCKDLLFCFENGKIKLIEEQIDKEMAGDAYKDASFGTGKLGQFTNVLKEAVRDVH